MRRQPPPQTRGGGGEPVSAALSALGEGAAHSKGGRLLGSGKRDRSVAAAAGGAGAGAGSQAGASSAYVGGSRSLRTAASGGESEDDAAAAAGEAASDDCDGAGSLDEVPRGSMRSSNNRARSGGGGVRLVRAVACTAASRAAGMIGPSPVDSVIEGEQEEEEAAAAEHDGGAPHHQSKADALVRAGIDCGASDQEGDDDGCADGGTGDALGGGDEMFRPQLLPTQGPSMSQGPRDGGGALSDDDGDGGGADGGGKGDAIIVPIRGRALQLPSSQQSPARRSRAAATASAPPAVASSLLDVDLDGEYVPTPGKGDARTVDEIRRQEAQRKKQAAGAASSASVAAASAAAARPPPRGPPATRLPPAPRPAAAPNPAASSGASGRDPGGSLSQSQASAAPPQRDNKRLHKAADAPPPAAAVAASQRAAPAAAAAGSAAAPASTKPPASKKAKAPPPSPPPPPPPRVPVSMVGVGVLQSGPPFELPPHFTLHSVIRHEGSRAYAGHYTADVRRAPAPAAPASATRYHTPATAAATEELLREAAVLGLCRSCDGLHVPADGRCSDCTSRAMALRAAAGGLPAGTGRAAKRQRAAPAASSAAPAAAAAAAADGSDWEWDRHDDSSIRRLSTAQVTGENGQQQAYVLIYVLDESTPRRAPGTAAQATSA